MRHEVEWQTPLPLRAAAGAGRPAVLGFASDQFMDDLAGELGDPKRLGSLQARRVKANESLYQPVHGRFYLVTASLVCRQPGWPDRAVNAGRQEAVKFVIRRTDGPAEQAWVTGEKGRQWEAVARPGEVGKSEETFPLFPMSGAHDGRPRRVFAGLIPAASRDTFVAAPTDPPLEFPKLAADARYVVRCVYSRPKCEPWEGPIVSAPTDEFRLAAVFDPDAPARTIRIVLPTDLGALAKHAKNVGFVMGKELRNKMVSATSPKVLKGEKENEGTFDVGEICSLSIPIITLCASIVLFLFLGVLNLVFQWLLLIKICLPIPKSK